MIDIYHGQARGTVLKDDVLKDGNGVKQEECMVK